MYALILISLAEKVIQLAEIDGLEVSGVFRHLVKISEECYAIYTAPSTSNPTGHCHCERHSDGHCYCCRQHVTKRLEEVNR